MRKFRIFTLALFITCGIVLSGGTAVVSAANTMGISAQAFALVDEFGNVIFENNAHTRLPMASTTKIMTAIVALENLDTQQLVKIPREAVGVEGSSAYLKEGESLKVIDLLYALLLQSANDSAVALAIAAKGSVSLFCDAMNEKAVLLGLTNTHFDNPHGLDSKEHYTTAYELAIMTAKAFEEPQIAEIMGTHKYTCISSAEDKRTFVNHNKLLTTYAHCIGGKTGFTKADGRCLATASEDKGVRLIAATLNAPNDWDDHKKLYNAGFALYKEQKLCDAFEYTATLKVVGADVSFVPCHNSASVYAFVRSNDEISFKIELAEFEYAPIIEGQRVGRVVFFQNGCEIAYAELVASTEIPTKEDKETQGFWNKIINFFKRIFAAIFKP